ncbi:hypothetical protein Lfu02_62330 [Longispora fulva]|uniref:Lipoprotein n=1 Tax=Longispora fulva TaxID=619741 RepID=A0A8J7GMZ5_9ACTN|nr:hypothetical protein [Longispora fulva]MBG6134653.1 hypothetical protein [Longispora fulva]GIG61861.1 hypothetical protein Lfu02_62330 [Longispora fulva]
MIVPALVAALALTGCSGGPSKTTDKNAQPGTTPAAATFALDDSRDAGAPTLTVQKGMCGKFDIVRLVAMYPKIEPDASNYEDGFASCTLRYAQGEPERLSMWIDISDKTSARLARFNVRGTFLESGEKGETAETLEDFPGVAYLVTTVKNKTLTYRVSAQAGNLVVDMHFFLESDAPAQPNATVRAAAIDAAKGTVTRLLA